MHRAGITIALLASVLAVAALGWRMGWWLNSQEESVESFVARHWQDPLPPQGEPPARFTALEASLGPDACGQCHTAQYADWRGSQHSKSMGAGIGWQLRLMGQGEANRCLRCHAPLAEQKALVAIEQGWSAAPSAPRPAYVPETLAHDGLSCAACHLRNHQRVGPPARAATKLAGTAHDGYRASGHFEASRFCAACHQFPDDGPRVAGKLQEDTFAQWRASPFATQQTCQQCHMPDRRHLFRGIHDPQMVERALETTLAVEPAAAGQLEATVRLRNVGAGHHFPTYMVPKVIVDLTLVGPAGERRAVGRDVIGWAVDADLKHEVFDTRIPAGGEHRFRQRFTPPRGAGWSVELTVNVIPREHYERVFERFLTQPGVNGEARALLDQALTEARAARYQALQRRVPLPAAVRR